MLLHRPNPLDAPLYRRRVAEVSDIHRIVKALVEVRMAWKLTQNDVSSRMGIRRLSSPRRVLLYRRPGSPLISMASTLRSKAPSKTSPSSRASSWPTHICTPNSAGFAPLRILAR
jgi:hypothetical protein